MATYHGIVKAECKRCGFTSTNATTLEMWNDGIEGCPGCNELGGDIDSVWTLDDGRVTHVKIRNVGSLDYSEERRELINMDALSDLINKRGVKCYVEHTGGGCATLYIGEEFTDEHGDPRMVLLGGPGTLDHRDYGFSTADVGEFYVGPDDDGANMEAHVNFTEAIPLAQMADQIVAQHHQAVEAMKQKPAKKPDIWLAYEMDGGPSGIWWEVYAGNDANVGELGYSSNCLVNTPSLDHVIKSARKARVRLILHTQEWYEEDIKDKS